MLVTHTERPRELRWYHAGPMLYGDWGTSRFYVLGLALFYSLHASFWFVFAVGMLVAAVGWAYTIICRCYPDGGGVYSAAKHTSRQLAVVGALLLFADYIVTASLSAYDGIRYMGLDKQYVPYAAMGAIFAVGVVNYVGPKKAGTVALYITLATLVLTTILGIFSMSHMAAGWAAIHRPNGTITVMWTSFVGVVLALSGVEAIANMTGIMVPPVTKTANKAIWPVLIEVVLLNIVLAIAMNGLPAAGYDLGKAPGQSYREVEKAKEANPTWQTDAAARAAVQTVADEQAKNAGVNAAELIEHSTDLKEHIDDTQDAVLRVMAKVYVDPYMTIHINGKSIGLFSIACGFIFGLLLLSAVNTAVADMISIQYVMSRDTELPHVLTKLNVFGVPWYALIAAVGLPILLLTIFQDLDTLSNLYAVGVVGAIAINLGSCCANKQMPVKNWERAGLGILAVIMVCIELTLLYQKPDARYFAGLVVGAGLAARFFTKTYPLLSHKARGVSLVCWGAALVTGAGFVIHYQQFLADILQEKIALLSSPRSASNATYAFSSLMLMAGGAATVYAIRYLLGKMPVITDTTKGFALELTTSGNSGGTETAIDTTRPHVLVASRGARDLLDFAASYCRKTGANMYVLFVRQVNVLIPGNTSSMPLSDDPEAIKAFTTAEEIATRNGIHMTPIYAVSPDVAYTILDYAATYGAEAVLMGVSRQGALLRALKGDVLTAVADNLPKDIPMLIHA